MPPKGRTSKFFTPSPANLAFHAASAVNATTSSPEKHANEDAVAKKRPRFCYPTDSAKDKASPSIENGGLATSVVDSSEQASPSIETGRLAIFVAETPKQASPSIETGGLAKSSVESPKQASPSIETGGLAKSSVESPKQAQCTLFQREFNTKNKEAVPLALEASEVEPPTKIARIQESSATCADTTPKKFTPFERPIAEHASGGSAATGEAVQHSSDAPTTSAKDVKATLLQQMAASTPPTATVCSPAHTLHDKRPVASPVSSAPSPSPSPKGRSKGKPWSPSTTKAGSSIAPNVGGQKLPLEGFVMCFTGELDSISRPEAEEKAKAAGAKVMGSVSGNTGYLVMGSHLDDGRKVEETSKYRKYLDLKEKGKKFPQLLYEQQFLDLFPKEATASTPDAATTSPMANSCPPSAPQSAAPCDQNPKAVPSSHRLELANWVDLYAPKGFGELVGNASIVRKLSEWLRDWESVVLKGNSKRVPFKPGGGAPENINARATLISGPPGIGKTTTCRLVAQLHGGYEVLEYNASDARGQKIIQEMAEGIADNTTISFGGNLGGKKVSGLTKRACIIMDEVDGMGAGDRGGNAALIKMIKKTRNPIICICNDQGSQKIRSLASSCYDLKFSRPTKATIAQRCADIARAEGLQVEPNALEELAESCGSDMRMVLNQLQMLARSPMYKNVGVKYLDMKQRIAEISKDSSLMLTPFDACKKLLTSSDASRLDFRQRMDMFFIDHSLVPLLVQENYLRSVEKKPVDAMLLNRCAYSADLFTLGDVIGSRIRGDQEWNLLPDMGVTSTVYPSFATNGFVAFPSFPQWLGQYSAGSKMKRLATELQTHLRMSSTVSRRTMITSGQADLLYKRAVSPLINGGQDGIETTAGILDAYGLRKDHLMEHMTELSTHLGGQDLFKTVDSKVKAALTREFNAGGHAMKVMLPTGSKKRKVAAEGGNPDEFDEDVEKDKAAEADEEAEKSDDDAGGMLLKPKGKAKAKGKANAKGTPQASSTGRGKAKAKARI